MDFRGQKNFGARVKSGARREPACAPWAVLLPDAVDGLLSEAEQRALDQHLAGCAGCSEELAAAQRGLAWLTVLKDQAPEPPAGMLANILAQTTGYAAPARGWRGCAGRRSLLSPVSPWSLRCPAFRTSLSGRAAPPVGEAGWVWAMEAGQRWCSRDWP